MNATLEQYLSQVEDLGEEAQQELTRRIQDFFEEQMIDRKLKASVERGGWVDSDEVFDRLEKKITQEYGV